MTIFGWVDLAIGLGIVLGLVILAGLWIRALFKRHRPGGETYIRWPRWLPHPHDWQERAGWFSTVKPEREVHETCMRCRRTRRSRVIAALIRENNGLEVAAIVSRLDEKDRERIDAILDEDGDDA